MPVEPLQKSPLPRGRHKLTPAAVRASQRERLVEAMITSVGERGYNATTVPSVVAAAHVSRNAFYDLFDDKLDCFMAAWKDMDQGLLTALMSSAAEPDWVSAVSAGMDTYLRWWQARPGFMRTYFVEIPAAGPAAVEERDNQFAQYRAMFEALAERARVEDPQLPPIPPLAIRLLVVGLTELMGEEWRAGRVDQLHNLREELTHHVVTVLTCG